MGLIYTRWFKYDRDYLCVNKSQFVPVIFEPPCSFHDSCKTPHPATNLHSIVFTYWQRIFKLLITIFITLKKSMAKPATTYILKLTVSWKQSYLVSVMLIQHVTVITVTDI